MMNDLNDHDNDDDDNRQNPTHFFILTIQPKSTSPRIVFVRIVFVKSLFSFLTKLMKEIILLYYYHIKFILAQIMPF